MYLASANCNFMQKCPKIHQNDKIIKKVGRSIFWSKNRTGQRYRTIQRRTGERSDCIRGFRKNEIQYPLVENSH